MNKFIKSLLVALAVIPCAAVFAACDGTTTPPSYEISEGGHSFSEYSAVYIKTEKGDYGYFEYTDKDFNEILVEYAQRLEEEYYPKIGDDDWYMRDYDVGEVETVLSWFVGGQSFELSVPDATNTYSGLLTIKESNDYDAEALGGCTDLAVTVSQTNGDMQIASAPEYYGESYVDYSYKNGVITVEIDAAEIVKEFARENSVSQLANTYIPPLWIQFTLS